MLSAVLYAINNLMRKFGIYLLLTQVMIINSVAIRASNNVVILIQYWIKYYVDLPWREHSYSSFCINNYNYKYKYIYVLLRWLEGHLWVYEEKLTKF